jgi:hypothetical protein
MTPDTGHLPLVKKNRQKAPDNPTCTTTARQKDANAPASLMSSSQAKNYAHYWSSSLEQINVKN